MGLEADHLCCGRASHLNRAVVASVTARRYDELGLSCEKPLFLDWYGSPWA
jgi:hypothetical protein